MLTKIYVVSVKIKTARYYLTDLEYTLSKNVQDSVVFMKESTAELFAADCEHFFENHGVHASCYTDKEEFTIILNGAELSQSLLDRFN
ncbi:hypothetical protein [Pectinatus frisingensis]|uniref:hypothetical protein n=1 Tax=Pectinatus frisingensis TaxID=865 RepID=UPI0018C71A83|nr:hypothetical protein [Pectinatus frisingensis]